MRERENK